MNRKLLKKTGDYLTLAILVLEFPVFSFLITLDLTVRYVIC